MCVCVGSVAVGVGVGGGPERAKEGVCSLLSQAGTWTRKGGKAQRCQWALTERLTLRLVRVGGGLLEHLQR